MAHSPPKPNARSKLLEAAVSVIRAKGYAATTVDNLCERAGVTKGAFFHHFESKDELGVAAAAHWSETTGALFAAAAYHHRPDPLGRVLGYLELRKALLQGSVPEFTCLVGTMIQEAYLSVPAIRAACARSIGEHAATLEADLEAALRAPGVSCAGNARSLALHTQAVLQGAFILAKAEGGPERAAESIDHLIRYFELLFSPKKKRATASSKRKHPRR